MTELESWMYGDPEQVAIRKEQIKIANEKSCGQCVNSLVHYFQDGNVAGCKFKRRVYGRRCELYEVKK